MHPRLYPFIVNGPACACGHRRVAHIGVHAKYPVTVTDVACTECSCDGYTPVEAIDREAEAATLAQIFRSQQQRVATHRKITSFLAVATVAVIPTMIWNPDLFVWLLVLIIVAGAANMAVAAVGQWRRGDLDTFDVVVTAALVAGTLAFVVSLTTGSPLMAAAVLGLLALAVIFGLRARQDLGRTKRTFDAMATDLEDRLRDDDS